MNKKQKNSLLTLTECSIMIALSTVLSIIKLFEMPYGGSITLASMLPIIIISFRHGNKIGIGTALSASLIQLLLGMNNFSYFTTWQSIAALAICDYVLAFTVFGATCFGKRLSKNQSEAMAIGAAIASVCRYACHVISGATVWAGLSIPTEAAFVYSLSYNATYMIPESLILVITCFYIGSTLDFSRKIPARKKMKKLDTVSSYLYIGAGAVALGGLIWDTVMVFSALQNSESGEFYIMGLHDVNWLAVAIITVACACLALAMVLIAKGRSAACALDGADESSSEK